jgi:hypothetical protein
MKSKRKDSPPPESPSKDIKEWFRRSAPVIYGFLGWWIVNGALWILSELLFFVNIIGLVILGIKYPKIAFGALVAFALNLVASLIMGLAAAGTCFIPFFTPGADSFFVDDNLAGIPECLAVAMLIIAAIYGSFLWNRRNQRS